MSAKLDGPGAGDSMHRVKSGDTSSSFFFFFLNELVNLADASPPIVSILLSFRIFVVSIRSTTSSLA